MKISPDANVQILRQQVEQSQKQHRDLVKLLMEVFEGEKYLLEDAHELHAEVRDDPALNYP